MSSGLRVRLPSSLFHWYEDALVNLERSPLGQMLEAIHTPSPLEEISTHTRMCGAQDVRSQSIPEPGAQLHEGHFMEKATRKKFPCVAKVSKSIARP